MDRRKEAYRGCLRSRYECHRGRPRQEVSEWFTRVQSRRLCSPSSLDGQNVLNQRPRGQNRCGGLTECKCPSVREQPIIRNVECITRSPGRQANVKQRTTDKHGVTYIAAGLVGSRSFCTKPVSATYAVLSSGEKQSPLGMMKPSATIDTRPGRRR